MINSLKLGVRNLEMDLQVTKDGKVVVSHDPYLKGFNKQYPIYKNDYAVLAEKNIGMIPDSDYVHRKNIDCHIPLLSELIDSTEQYCLHNAISPVDYTIEIKSTVKRDGILAPEYKAYTDSCLKVLLAKKLGNRLLIQSFDIRTLKYIHDKYPEVRLMYLVNKNANDYESAMEKLGFIPEVISRNYDKVDRTFVEKAHKDGVEVISYIGDETSVVPNLVKIGVDAVMTNRPDLVFKSIK